MANNLSKNLVEQMPEQPDTMRGPPTIQDRRQGIELHASRPLDWSHAVDAAAARLEENWVSQGQTGPMLASGLAEEFAATLCAFGMVAAEVDHMHDRSNSPATERRPPR